MNFTLAMIHNWLLQKIPNTNLWLVWESFIWFMDYKDKKDKIVIPKWFDTDFWSIPRLLRMFFNPTRYISYILHDRGYSKLNTKYTRKEIDLMLLEALHIEWASFIERTCVYIGLRIGWWYAWRKNKKSLQNPK